MWKIENVPWTKKQNAGKITKNEWKRKKIN